MINSNKNLIKPKNELVKDDKQFKYIYFNPKTL